MDLKEQIPQPEEALDEMELDTGSSVEEFIKELEAKEKALHITADYEIVVEDPDFDADSVPDFVRQEIAPAVQHQSATVTDGAPPQPAANPRVHELEQEIGKLSARIVDLRAERKEIQEKSDRRMKDFENYKYRMDRERRGSFIDQIANLASQMLPVLDNLDRALDSVEQSGSEKNDEFQQFYNGIVLVNQQVNEVFAEMGVQPIITAGEVFDPAFHEAVATEDRDDLPPNSISAEMLRGWRIGNKVIRHSMVRVTMAPSSKKDVKAEPVPQPEEPLPDPTDPTVGQ